MCKKVAIGYDHRGLRIKETVIEAVEEAIGKGRNSAFVCECRPWAAKATSGEPLAPVDYPIQAVNIAEAVAKEDYTFGILICGTGIGMSIAANKVPGIRAAHVNNLHDAKATRLHNDANILCLGSDHFEPVQDTSVLKEIVNTFLTTTFEGGRHQKRLQIITDTERKCSIRHASRLMLETIDTPK